MTLKEFRKELEKYGEYWALYCFGSNIKGISFKDVENAVVLQGNTVPSNKDEVVFVKAVVLVYSQFYKEKTINIKEFLEKTKDKNDNYKVLAYNDLLGVLFEPNVLEVICDTNLDFTYERCKVKNTDIPEQPCVEPVLER